MGSCVDVNHCKKTKAKTPFLIWDVSQLLPNTLTLSPPNHVNIYPQEKWQEVTNISTQH